MYPIVYNWLPKSSPRRISTINLSAVQSSSARQRWRSLVVFGVTLLLAGVILNLTIRRTITGPILRVIHGVQEAPEQATSIEETSAALEQISATTRENANWAGEADRLMRSATTP